MSLFMTPYEKCGDQNGNRQTKADVGERRPHRAGRQKVLVCDRFEGEKEEEVERDGEWTLPPPKAKDIERRQERRDAQAVE